jgi:hypothetical protein
MSQVSTIAWRNDGTLNDSQDGVILTQPLSWCRKDNAAWLQKITL